MIIDVKIAIVRIFLVRFIRLFSNGKSGGYCNYCY